MDTVIRHVEPEDFEAVRRIYAGLHAVAGTMQIPYPSAAMWRKRIADSAPEHRGLVCVANEEIVGHLSLSTIARPRRAHVAHLGIAVRDDWQGRGIGTRLMDAALSLADGWLNVLRIELTVYADNAAARRLYEKFGFVVEGRHLAYALRDGAYVDALSMARLHPRPPTLRGQ